MLKEKNTTDKVMPKYIRISGYILIFVLYFILLQVFGIELESSNGEEVTRRKRNDLVEEEK